MEDIKISHKFMSHEGYHVYTVKHGKDEYFYSTLAQACLKVWKKENGFKTLDKIDRLVAYSDLINISLKYAKTRLNESYEKMEKIAGYWNMKLTK